jgi:dolichol kinase
MAWDFKNELARKGVHLLSLFFIAIFVIVSESYGERLALFSLVILLVLLIEIDYLRVELKKKLPLINRFFRSKEKNKLGGQVFFLMGAIICLAVFDFRIAIAALLMTTFGDMSAALIGKKFGRTWISKTRALEGIVAEFIVDVVIGYFVLGSWIVILVMAITATVVESIISKLDDNLIIPVFSGFNGQVATYILVMLGKI